MVKGLFGAVLMSTVLLWLLGWTRALANDGVLAGLEFLTLAAVGLLAALVFVGFALRAGVPKAKTTLIAIVVWTVLPISIVVFPTAFCILFIPNTSCI